MPDFAGEPVAEAAAWASDAELWWKAQFPPLPPSDAKTLFDAYTVRTQSPQPGQQLSPGVIEKGDGFRPTPLVLTVAPASP